MPNPSPSNQAHLTVRYVDQAGNVTVRTPTVNAQTRLTVEVFNPLYGVGRGIAGVSAEITSDQPIVAERPMYMVHDFGTGPVAGAHDVMGQTGLGTLFGFATASTAARENDYLTIQNPNAAAASLTITYYPGGTPVTRLISVSANSRHTVAVFQPAEGIGAGSAPV